MKKICKKCNLEKSLTREFWNLNANRKDGFDHPCKLCKRLSSNKIGEDISRRNRDKRRYLRDKFRLNARRLARDTYGSKEYPCSVLNCEEIATDLHHVTYEDPLAVVPLCKRHHKDEHVLNGSPRLELHQHAGQILLTNNLILPSSLRAEV